MKDNVVDFMLKKAEINRNNELEDYEEWETEAEFFAKKDWGELVKYRYRQAERYPDDPYCQWSLGEAYVLNKEYQRAIHFLTSLHEKYPDHQDIQYSLLDALFAIGKDENAVDWIKRPIVFRLNSAVLDFCHEFLKRKRKPITVYDLHIDLYGVGYPVFNDRQLMQFLGEDKKFLVQNICAESYECFVSVVRKKR
jgi:tetratricopeptide (TPR) repeat protein